MKRTLHSVLAVVCVSAIAIISCEKVSVGGTVKTEPNSPQLSIMEVNGAAALFTGKEDHSYPVQAAQEMMAAFQSDNPFETYGWYFGREAIEWLLAQDGAVGIRIYGGFKPTGQFSPVILGVDAQGNDIGIYSDGLYKSLSDSTRILERAFPCCD